MNIYTIYRATNIINNKTYIGFTSLSIEDRMNIHLKNSKNNIITKFYNGIRKYGWDNFTWEIIYQSLDMNHTLNTMENYFIIEHDSFRKGYNSTLGGGGTPGRIIPEEEKIKRRKIANDVYSKMSEEERLRKFGKSGKDNHFYGKTHDKETSLKMKASHAVQRSLLMKCGKCGKEVDAQNYALHHGDKCGVGSAIRGRKWYHLEDVSYYLYPDDPKIIDMGLKSGRSKSHKRSNQFIKKLDNLPFQRT